MIMDRICLIFMLCVASCRNPCLMPQGFCFRLLLGFNEWHLSDTQIRAFCCFYSFVWFNIKNFLIFLYAIMGALQSRELKWEGHHTFLYSQLQFMLEKESYVDVILANTEGQSIKVHRLVLCAASPFFKVKHS